MIINNEMNRKLFWVLLIVVVILIVFGLLRFVFGGPEDSWVCKEGVWVKHGNPDSSMPLDKCE